MRFNKIKSFPLDFCFQKTLVVIDLAGNRLHSIPSDCFRFCSELSSLNLSDNELCDLPSSIWDCTKLQWLNFFSNNIRDFSSDIGKLIHLRELYAGNNILTLLPKEMVALGSLKILHLAGNAIEVLDAGVLGQSLEKLYFSRNDLFEFPNSLTRLTKLETIDFSGNKISHATITGVFPALQELVLSHNRLEQFSFSQKECSFPKLVVLDLSSNEISSVPDVSEVKDLEILNLLHCNISHVNCKRLDQHAKLSIIYMQGNPVEKSRDLRLSFVERKTDLLITDLFKGPNNTMHVVPRLRSSTDGQENDILSSWSEIKGARTTQEDTMTVRQDLGTDFGGESMQL